MGNLSICYCMLLSSCETASITANTNILCHSYRHFSGNLALIAKLSTISSSDPTLGILTQRAHITERGKPALINLGLLSAGLPVEVTVEHVCRRNAHTGPLAWLRRAGDSSQLSSPYSAFNFMQRMEPVKLCLPTRRTPRACLDDCN